MAARSSWIRTALLAALWVGVSAAMGFGPSVVRAEPGGITRAGQGCDDPADSCHGDPSAGVIVEISGPSQLDLGEVGTFTVALREAMEGFLAEACTPGPCGAGMNVAVFDAVEASLPFVSDDVVDANTRLSIAPLGETSGEITHLHDANLNGPSHNSQPGSIGVYAYTFEVAAPTEPEVLTVYAAMNAFNGDDVETGDHWSTDAWAVQVPEPAGPALGGAALAGLAALRSRRRRA